MGDADKTPNWHWQPRTKSKRMLCNDKPDKVKFNKQINYSKIK